MSRALYQGPGPWTVRLPQPWGYEVTRAMGNWESEWLKGEDGEALVFDTREDAQAAADRANEVTP